MFFSSETNDAKLVHKIVVEVQELFLAFIGNLGISGQGIKGLVSFWIIIEGELEDQGLKRGQLGSVVGVLHGFYCGL